MRASTAAAVDVAVRSHVRTFQSMSKVSCKAIKTAMADCHVLVSTWVIEADGREELTSLSMYL